MTYYASFLTYCDAEVRYDIVRVDDAANPDEVLGAVVREVGEKYPAEEGWSVPSVKVFEHEDEFADIPLDQAKEDAIAVLMDAGLVQWADDDTVDYTDAGRTILAAFGTLVGVPEAGG